MFVYVGSHAEEWERRVTRHDTMFRCRHDAGRECSSNGVLSKSIVHFTCFANDQPPALVVSCRVLSQLTVSIIASNVADTGPRNSLGRKSLALTV